MRAAVTRKGFLGGLSSAACLAGGAGPRDPEKLYVHDPK